MNKKALLVVASLMVLPAVSFAQASSDAGLYIGGSIGRMKAEGSCPSGFSCDLTDTGWKAFAGYRFGRNFALEGTYARWGEIAVSTGAARATGEIQSIGVAAVGILPLGDAFDLFGKLGVLSTEQKFRASGPGITSTGFDDGTEAHFGAGVTYKINRNFGIRAEWERLNKSEVDFLSIGVQYRF